MNNKLTEEQVVTLQLRIMNALSFYRQRTEKAAKNMVDLLMLCGAAASELQESRQAGERLQESAYKAGLTAGWNFGIEHNSAGFSKCLAAHEYAAPHLAPKEYQIGAATMRHVFKRAALTDVSDLQAVFDQVEKALNHMECGQGSDVTCKYCGGSGEFRWQESANMMPCPCVGCATGPDKGPAMPVVCFVSTPNGSEDTSRLDWLDAQNKRLNEYYGTSYGWKFDANFQRNAMMLNDSNYPVMDVRQAIDEAITATQRQEQRTADREASKNE